MVDGQQEMGCGHRCSDCTAQGECPFACPENPRRLAMMVGEVKSLNYRPRTQLLGPRPLGFPIFAPQIYHASGRSRPLRVDAAAICIGDLLSRTKGRSVYEAFLLDPETRVIGLGVSKDHELEKWWGDRNHVVEALKRLQLDAVTVPNFSIFANAPRSQALVSLARMHNFADLLSSAGIPVVPHIYAETDPDWERWTEILRDQLGVSMIAMEFQTGLLRQEKALPYISKLQNLQQQVGRELHLIAVGGSGYRAELQTAFGRRCTMTDATPFAKAFRRIKLDTIVGEVQDKHADLSDLLQSNVSVRERELQRASKIAA